MAKHNNDNENSNNGSEFSKLLDKDTFRVPKAGDIVKGTVLTASKAEVRLDVDGILTGVVRGQELYEGAEEYANLKPGDEVEATVIDEENENGEMELSFRYAGHEKAWAKLREAFKNGDILKVKVTAANRGGLLVALGQINGFLPVSQLSPEKYPRVSGGDKLKILEKLKSFIGEELAVKVVNLDEDQKEEKIIFSEKDVWNDKQKDIISKYKVGTIVEGRITAVASFGVFITFGNNLEGLIHISELAWQRIDDPSDLFKVGDKIKAEVISLEGSKIFLSVKKLIKDPWKDVEEKYKIGQKVKGTIIKINPFGLFIKLDDDIHGLAHISQLNLAPGQKINEAYKINDKVEFAIVSIEPKNHRLGLAVDNKEAKEKSKSKEEKGEKEAGEKKPALEKKPKAKSKDKKEKEAKTVKSKKK